MNKIFIMGNLGQTPELRRTKNDMAVTQLNVATKSFSKRGDGPTQETTEWFSVIVWDKSAENCCKFLDKGSKVLVEGRMQSRKYEKDGVQKMVWEIVANNVQFLSEPKKAEEKKENDINLDDIPFG